MITRTIYKYKNGTLYNFNTKAILHNMFKNELSSFLTTVTK